MAARIVICPVDAGVESDGVMRRMPRVGNIPDPGKPGAMCVFTSAISNGQPGEENDFCLCLVAAIDLSAVDADPEVETLFEVGDDQPLKDLHGWLEKMPKDLGWKANKISAVKRRISVRGVTPVGLTRDVPLREFVNRIARRYATPGWDIRNAMTTRAGA